MLVNPVGDSATANTKPEEHDPFPSFLSTPFVSAIDDNGSYGDEVPQVPDFVRRDNENFNGA